MFQERYVKSLEYVTGTEVHSVILYGEHKSKCIAQLISIIHQNLEKKEML